MSKASKRKKRERDVEKLATTKMLRALRNEKQRTLVCLIRIEIDESQAHKLQVAQSAIRKWERENAHAHVDIGTHMSEGGGT